MIKFDIFDINQYKHNLIIVDSAVSTLYNISGDSCLALDGGEQLKTWSTLQQICNWLQANMATKQTLVVAIGGGTIGDVVGLGCSIFKRGLPLLHIPTTLLAMVDSSIGGKTAINNDGVKNIIGTVHDSRCLIDINFLATLPEEQWLNGYGEVYKYMLLDRTIWHCDITNIEQVVRLCASYKQEIVSQDLMDNNIRQSLNIGHTVAHALELRYNIAHGQAVKLGLYYELVLAYSLDKVSREYINTWQRKTGGIGALLTIDDIVLDNMRQDKKNSDSNDELSFVLPCDNWQYAITRLSAQQVQSAIDKYATDLLICDK